MYLNPAVTALIIAVSLSYGCGGQTFDENEPGSDTYLDDGSPRSSYEDEFGRTVIPDQGDTCSFFSSFAIDHILDTAFVVQSRLPIACADSMSAESAEVKESKALYALKPGVSEPHKIADLTGASDLRMLFPKDQLLVMAEEEEQDRLIYLDRSTYEVLHTEQTTARYYGTRMSPTRRYVIAADNSEDDLPIHVIDTSTRETTILPHQGWTLEAMWRTNSDELVAFVQQHGVSEDGQHTSYGESRIMSWEIEEGKLSQMRVGDNGLWTQPRLNVQLNVQFNMIASYSWISMSPDGAFAAIPVSQEGQYTAAIVHLESGETRYVDRVKGPLGVTPDSSTVVGFYEYLVGEEPNEEYRSDLVLIDIASLETTRVPLGRFAYPEYYVSSSGHEIVIAPELGEGIILLDLDSGELTEMSGPKVALREFVNRDGDLWLIDGGLFHLDLDAARTTEKYLQFRPDHIGYLPNEDLLVLDDIDEPLVRFVRPDTLEEHTRVRFSSENDGS